MEKIFAVTFFGEAGTFFTKIRTPSNSVVPHGIQLILKGFSRMNPQSCVS